MIMVRVVRKITKARMPLVVVVLKTDTAYHLLELSRPHDPTRIEGVGLPQYGW